MSQEKLYNECYQMYFICSDRQRCVRFLVQLICKKTLFSELYQEILKYCLMIMLSSCRHTKISCHLVYFSLTSYVTLPQIITICTCYIVFPKLVK